jgi:hypothetical protein
MALCEETDHDHDHATFYPILNQPPPFTPLMLLGSTEPILLDDQQLEEETWARLRPVNGR